VKLFIASIPYAATEDDLRSLFSEIGPIRRFHLVTTDGRSRGYGFVEYVEELDGLRAIDDLNDRLYMGRRLKVMEARDEPCSR